MTLVTIRGLNVEVAFRLLRLAGIAESRMYGESRRAVHHYL